MSASSAIGAGLGFLNPIAGNIFGQTSQADAQARAAQDRARLYNEYLSKRDTASGDIIGQLTAGGYSPYGPQTTTNTSSGYSSSTSDPHITAEYQPLESSLRGIVQGRLNSPSSLPAGYAENAVRSINDSYAGANQAAINAAGRKGLSGQQTYALASPTQTARAGQIADLRGNIPLLERQMQNQDLSLAQALTQAFGRGETTNTRYGQTGSTTAPPNIQNLMALLLGPGPNASMQTGYDQFGGGLQAGSNTGMQLIQMLMGGA